MRKDGSVTSSAGFDNFAGKEISVDNREGIGRLGQEAGDGGFARCDGTG